jgi:hypothetical protein
MPIYDSERLLVMPKKTMATRDTSESRIPLNECTELQVHVSQRTATLGIIDYSERRLMRMFDVTIDPVKKLSIAALIDDYRSGLIAVAWRAGEPVYVKVTRDR